MPRCPPLNPLILKLEAWSTGDQARWLAGTAPGRSLDGDKYAATLRGHTIRNAMRGYGRYLRFLANRGELDLDAGPADRVTPERLQAYVAYLRAAGNKDNTIATRFWDLRTALEIMVPGGKFRWITSPGGNAIRALFPQVHRAITVYHSRILYEWARQTMDAALSERLPIRRDTKFRNGLIIAVFAVRAPRIESLSRIRIGLQFVRCEEGYRLAFRREDMKTKRRLTYLLPASLTPYIERYLNEIREELLAGQKHDALWVNESGAPFGKRGIEGVIRKATKARFGEAFGQHRFRHAAGTTGPIEDPSQPAGAAAMLGASQAVVEAHYNLGNLQLAAARFHETLRGEREKSVGLARRLFSGRGEAHGK